MSRPTTGRSPPIPTKGVTCGGLHSVNLARRPTRGALKCACRCALKKRTDVSLLGGWPPHPQTEGALLAGCASVQLPSEGSPPAQYARALNHARSSPRPCALTSPKGVPTGGPGGLTRIPMGTASSPALTSCVQNQAADQVASRGGLHKAHGGEPRSVATPGRGPARGRGPALGHSCKRPRARRSALLPRHSGWKARHWKPSASYMAVSHVGQQKVPNCRRAWLRSARTLRTGRAA